MKSADTNNSPEGGSNVISWAELWMGDSTGTATAEERHRCFTEQRVGVQHIASSSQKHVTSTAFSCPSVDTGQRYQRSENLRARRGNLL